MPRCRRASALSLTTISQRIRPGAVSRRPVDGTDAQRLGTQRQRLTSLFDTSQQTIVFLSPTSPRQTFASPPKFATTNRCIPLLTPHHSRRLPSPHISTPDVGNLPHTSHRQTSASPPTTITTTNGCAHSPKYLHDNRLHSLKKSPEILSINTAVRRRPDSRRPPWVGPTGHTHTERAPRCGKTERRAFAGPLPRACGRYPYKEPRSA